MNWQPITPETKLKIGTKVLLVDRVDSPDKYWSAEVRKDNEVRTEGIALVLRIFTHYCIITPPTE